MGKGTSKFHEAPDRGLGPVWEDEWMARPDYFDAKLKEFGEEIEGKVEQKVGGHHLDVIRIPKFFFHLFCIS